MQLSLQISFRDMSPSAAVETKIRERADKLERYYDRIMGCRVVVEAPHGRHHQGKLFHVRIDLTVPGSELVVSREPAQHHEHEDVFVAIRDAFDAAQRQLADYAHRQRGATKLHEAPAIARVRRLFPEGDYGFIETAEGTEVYFHRNSVIDGTFDDLKVGSEVRVAIEDGDNGPQASTVHVVRS